MKSKIVLADIAKKLGIHKSTVSLALRNSPKISEGTRKLVKTTAEAMGYEPDPQLLSLASYRKTASVQRMDSTIAVLVDIDERDFSQKHYYMRHTTEAITARARDFGYRTDIFQIEQDAQAQSRLDEILKARGIRGILINHFYKSDFNIQLDWKHYACVKINDLPHNLKADTVSGNYLAAIDISIEKLQQMGHNRIAIALEKGDEIHLNNLCYSRFLAKQGVFPKEDRIDPFFFEEGDEETVHKDVQTWLAEVKPDALLAHWNLSKCTQWLKETTGHSCRFLSLTVEPSTEIYGGVRNRYDKIGEKAVQLLNNRLQSFKYGFPEAASTMLVDPEWVEPSR